MDIVDVSIPYEGKGCNLSDPKYCYDFVVSTTQASINSDLCLYLHNNTLPCSYFCFLLGPKNSNEVVAITLENLVSATGGVDPFKIPHGTSPADPRVKALTKVGFTAGIKIRMGLPPGVEPKNLPPILELGGDVPDLATFNILFSDFHVVQNEPSNATNPNGEWNVWKQPNGHPWTLNASVSLIHATLDNQLNYSAHFNQNPAKKQRILQKLQNMPGTFSLQQLLVDMENATVKSVPTMEGLKPGSCAHLVITGQLGNIWKDFVNKSPLPPISLVAVPQASSNLSTLRLTDFRMQVNLVKGSDGVALQNPTKEQLSATTLDYRCVTSSTSPPARRFTWNWVDPTQINAESGVIAIKRHVFAKYLLDTILPQAKKFCITTDPVVGNLVANNNSEFWTHWALPTINNQTPRTCISRGGDVLCTIVYSAIDDPDTRSTRGQIYNSDYCELQIVPEYDCSVILVDKILRIKQYLRVGVRFKVKGVSIGMLDIPNYDEPCTAFCKSIQDSYQLSVDQVGRLQIQAIANTHTSDDDSGYFNNNQLWFQTIQLVDRIRSSFTIPQSFDLSLINASSLQNFVFPGGKVFTYKDVKFAPSGDLLCSLTYMDPNEAVTSPAMLKMPVAQVKKDDQAPAIISVPVPPSSAANPFVTMTSTSDMIQNYVPGEIVKPTGKFEALQTEDGHSILFSLSATNVLQAIVEQSGACSTGWQVIDISSTALRSNFPNDANAVVKTFDVNQSVLDGTVSLAIIITSGGKDHLLLSLYNQNTITAWTPTITPPSLAWKLVPFDAPSLSDPITTPISIAGVLFAETDAHHRQKIIVDVDRSESDAIKLISRFYVNPHTTGTCWTSHDVPVDIQDGSYQSCVGRFRNEYVDGVFTCGVSGNSGQLVYVPISNAFGSGPPAPRILSLPGGVKASAIATARAFD